MNGKAIIALITGTLGASLNAADLSTLPLQERLNALKDSPAPEVSGRTMTCYVVAAPEARIRTFTCPKCGKTTEYDPKDYSEEVWRRLYFDVPHAVKIADEAMKQLSPLAKAQGLRLEVDATEFCKTCHPEVKIPALTWVITKLDAGGNPVGEAIRTPLQDGDRSLLLAFLQGKDTYQKQGTAAPIKPDLPRIAQILGLQMPSEPSK